MNNIYVSTGAFKEKTLAGILNLARENGFKNIELSSGVMLHDGLDEEVLRLPEEFAFLVHNYFPPESTGLVINLASGDDGIRCASIDFVKHSIDICGFVDSYYYSVHSGFCVDPKPENLGNEQSHLLRIPVEKAKLNFISSLQELLEHAKSRGVKLCIENNNIEKRNLIDGKNISDLMTGPKDFEEFMNIRELEEIGFLIDLGHLKVSAHTEGFMVEKFVEVTRDRIAMLHVSDNNGITDQHKPLSPDYWGFSILKQFRDIPFILEAYNLDVATIRNNVDYLEEIKEL